MANFTQLHGDVFVAPQLVEEDFAELARRGFRSVVCKRPDGEAPDQLPSARAAGAARRNGLQFRYRPVAGFDVTGEDAVEAFGALARELPGPVLFYCSSGSRCAMLWAQSAVAGLGVRETVETAARAGYDLSAIAEILGERAARPCS